MEVTTREQHAPGKLNGTVAQHGTAATARADWRDPRYQAFVLLRLTFTIAPIAFGVDKFFNVMVHWPNYLAPWISKIMPGTGQQFMYFVGATEILAGVILGPSVLWLIKPGPELKVMSDLGVFLLVMLAGMEMVAEGVYTTRSVHERAARMGIDMPIMAEVYRVLYEGKDPRGAVDDLMLRSPKGEH